MKPCLNKMFSTTTPCWQLHELIHKQNNIDRNYTFVLALLCNITIFKIDCEINFSNIFDENDISTKFHTLSLFFSCMLIAYLSECFDFFLPRSNLSKRVTLRRKTTILYCFVSYRIVMHCIRWLWPYDTYMSHRLTQLIDMCHSHVLFGPIGKKQNSPEF